MIIQSPLHKPSRVFTIHSFSNTYLSLSLSTRLSLFPFRSTISSCNSETSRYQPFLSAVLTAIPDAINPENSLREFPSDSKLHLCVYMYIYIQVSTFFSFSSSRQRSESPAGTSARSERQSLSLLDLNKGWSRAEHAYLPPLRDSNQSASVRFPNSML